MPRHFSVYNTSMHSKIEVSKEFPVSVAPRHGGLSFVRQCIILSSLRIYSSLPAWFTPDIFESTCGPGHFAKGGVYLIDLRIDRK